MIPLKKIGDSAVQNKGTSLQCMVMIQKSLVLIFSALFLSSCGRYVPPEPLNNETHPSEIFFGRINDAVLNGNIEDAKQGLCETINGDVLHDLDFRKALSIPLAKTPNMPDSVSYSVEFLAQRDGYTELVSLLNFMGKTMTQKINILHKPSRLHQEYCIEIYPVEMSQDAPVEEEEPLFQVPPDEEEMKALENFMIDYMTQRGLTEEMALQLSESERKVIEEELKQQVRKFREEQKTE